MAASSVEVCPQEVLPSYMVSNATSHTTAFSAMAELIDNASDANASVCSIEALNKENPGNEVLLIIDDGHGMSTDELKNMMNLGCSNPGTETRSLKPLGRYGNGFKSGSMHLAKDALVFTKKRGVISTALYSQTYNEGQRAVQIPVVSVKKLDQAREVVQQLKGVIDDVKFTVEELELGLKKINSLQHGTVILLKNLNYEFKFDDNDVKVGVDRSSSSGAFDHQRSLRDYCRILFKKSPNKSGMTIRIGSERVEPLDVKDLLTECEYFEYCPKKKKRATQKCTGVIGLNTSRELKNEYGVMMYWRDRLIRPFEKDRLGFGSRTSRLVKQHCIGVIELNEVLEPVHNKQDFTRDLQYLNLVNKFQRKLKVYCEKQNVIAACQKDVSKEVEESSDSDPNVSDDESDETEDRLTKESTSRVQSGSRGVRKQQASQSVPATSPAPSSSSDEREDSDEGEGPGGSAGLEDEEATVPLPGASQPITPDMNPQPGTSTSIVEQSPDNSRGLSKHAGDIAEVRSPTKHPRKKTPTKRPKPDDFQRNVTELLHHIFLFFDPDREPRETEWNKLVDRHEGGIEKALEDLMEEFGVLTVTSGKPASAKYDIPPPNTFPAKEIQSWDSITYIFLDTEGPIEDLHQIAAVRGEEDCFNEVNIQPDTMEACLKKLCTFLSRSKNNVLVAHSMDTQDRPALMKALHTHGLLQKFKQNVTGLLDSAILFRQMHPELDRHKLVDLVYSLLHKSHRSKHNALGDARILQELMNKEPGDDASRRKASKSIEYATEFFQNYQSLKRLIHSNILSHYFVEHMASSGLNLDHLQKVWKRSGTKGLMEVLAEPSGGTVRVTRKTIVADQIEKFFLDSAKKP